MKLDRIILSPSSRFLVGVATTLITLRALCYLVFRIFEIEWWTALDISELYSFQWVYLSLGVLRGLAHLILCAWVGVLLHHAYPNPSRKTRYWVWALIIVGLALYLLCHLLFVVYAWRWHVWALMIVCIGLSYLMPFSAVKPHDRAELIAMSIISAILYCVCITLIRHSWIQMLPVLSCLYYMILLSNDSAVQELTTRRWVKPWIITTSIISLIAAIYYLGYYMDSFATRGANIITAVLFILVQPVVVYPFIRRWHKKHTEL